jgi:hypothetical protein
VGKHGESQCAVYEIMWGNMVRARQTTEDSRVHALSMEDVSLQAHPEYIILIAFPRLQWLANTSQSYIIRTLPVLLEIRLPAACSCVKIILADGKF